MTRAAAHDDTPRRGLDALALGGILFLSGAVVPAVVLSLSTLVSPEPALLGTIAAALGAVSVAWLLRDAPSRDRSTGMLLGALLAPPATLVWGLVYVLGFTDWCQGCG